jgi:glutaconate CoA-transferase subunit A
MRDAVARHVPDGASICMGAALEALIPFAAGHELIRQGRRDLTLIGPISDILFDQLVGAGCVARIAAAWVGNVSAGLGHNYRRAVEQGRPRPVEVHDHSNLSIALALHAAALGVPYLPARTLLGTGLLDSNPGFKRATDPWTGEPLLLVPALVPDVTIVHVQRADPDGRAHVWGTLGVTREAAFAARRVIVVAEEIWPRERILSDPGLVLAPEIKVAAVVREPFGAFPSPVQGCYRRHHASYHRYHEETRQPEGFRAWLDCWVHGVADRQAFLARVGPEVLDGVRIRTPRPSEPLDYGA